MCICVCLCVSVRRLWASGQQQAERHMIHFPQWFSCPPPSCRGNHPDVWSQNTKHSAAEPRKAEKMWHQWPLTWKNNRETKKLRSINKSARYLTVDPWPSVNQNRNVCCEAASLVVMSQFVSVCSSWCFSSFILKVRLRVWNLPTSWSYSLANVWKKSHLKTSRM